MENVGYAVATVVFAQLRRLLSQAVSYFGSQLYNPISNVGATLVLQKPHIRFWLVISKVTLLNGL